MPATPVLVDGQCKKAAGDSVRVPMDFGDHPTVIGLLVDGNGNYVPTNTAISSFTVTCGGVGAPLVSSTQLDTPYQVSGLVSGGIGGGASYNLVYSVTLTDPDRTVLTRTGTIVIL